MENPETAGTGPILFNEKYGLLAINNVFGDTKGTIKQLETTIADGQRSADKLTGIIKTATTTIQGLQERAKIITDTTESSSDKAIKSYLKVKAELQI